MATNFSRSEPRADSVAYVLAASHLHTGRENAVRVLECLQERVETEAGWQPVLKTLFLVHRLLQDGSDAFAIELERETTVLNLGAFSDRSSGEAVHYSKHIRLYCEYLEETLLVRAEMRKLVPGVHFSLVSRKSDRGRPSEMDSVDSTATLLDVLSVLLPHVDRLMRCERCARPRSLPAEEDCPIAHAVLALLARDGLHVFRLISEATMRVLNAFTTLPTEHAVRAFALYSAFVESSGQFTSMCEHMRRLHSLGYLPRLEVPQLKQVNHERVLSALRKHVLSVDPDGKVARRVDAELKKPPSERIAEPVVGELEQLNQLQAWSKRHFPGRLSGLGNDGPGEVDLVQLSPQQQPLAHGAGAAKPSAFDDLLQLEPSATGLGAAHVGETADLLTLDLFDTHGSADAQHGGGAPPPARRAHADGHMLRHDRPPTMAPPPPHAVAPPLAASGSARGHFAHGAHPQHGSCPAFSMGAYQTAQPHLAPHAAQPQQPYGALDAHRGWQPTAGGCASAQHGAGSTGASPYAASAPNGSVAVGAGFAQHSVACGGRAGGSQSGSFRAAPADDPFGLGALGLCAPGCGLGAVSAPAWPAAGART
ncbi:hypothetical protein KFE25_009060 [Diacronema lutheri]|uniref:ENTH domain-containing protein n=2 Tax=Diacronema lutheri TaxID=2081491 RepID=A0A8J5XU56_DIALT|nr:hypothetical protein KFE25_009060 [Diacronema lutheri]